MADVTFRIDYTVHVWEESRTFVAHAMPLDIMSHGDTPEEARHAVDEAVSLFFNTAQDMGTLHDVLEESGYTYDGSKWMSPSPVSVERHSLSISES